MKKTLLLLLLTITLLCLILCLVSCSQKKGEDIDADTSGRGDSYDVSTNSIIDSSTLDGLDGEDEIVPTDLLTEGMITLSQLEYLCNDNGIPLIIGEGYEKKLENGDWSIARFFDEENYSILILDYNEHKLIDSACVTISHGEDDYAFYKFQRMMYYMLQLTHFHIPVDDANKVINYFNENSEKTFWQLDVNGHEYDYMIDPQTGFYMFQITWEY